MDVKVTIFIVFENLQNFYPYALAAAAATDVLSVYTWAEALCGSWGGRQGGVRVPHGG